MAYLNAGLGDQARMGRAEPRSALGPCRNGRVRALAVTNGHRRLTETAGRRPSSSRSRDDASGRFRLWSRWSKTLPGALNPAASHSRADPRQP